MPETAASSGVVDLAERAAARARMRERVMEAVRAHFRPELLNRIDDVVIFNPLGREQIKAIVDIQLRSLRKRLAERKMDLELTDAAKELLAVEGFDPVYGARPLRRAIQQQIVQPLALRLLQAEFQDGDTIVVDVHDGRLDFRRKETRVPAGVSA
jgi:ATP-dependent Clp protease ATP-binding subunit ClpB